MLNNSPVSISPKTAYIICFVVAIIIIVLVLMCLTGKEPFEQTKEDYIVGTGPFQATNDRIMSQGAIISDQNTDRPFKSIANDAKSASYIRDTKSDPWKSDKIDKLIANGNSIRNIVDKAYNNEILTKEEMKKAAAAYHEGDSQEIALFDRAKRGPGKMVIVDRAIPVLDTNGKEVSGFPFGGRNVNHTLYATHSVYKIPYYECNPENPLGSGFKFTEAFRNDEGTKLINPLDSREVKDKAVAEAFMKSANGKTAMEKYKRASAKVDSEPTYFVNKAQLVVN